ncbi:MAG TPA: molybdopterin-dependent oxidoreductase, partial [Solirubrobacteraceae bacterium]|nr:molybdopterin-dependent oxidoreductase [Solirubrobacteraceae bacterium]
LYGERLLDGGAGGLLELAEALGLAATAGAGLIGIPDAANGRGLREAGAAAGVGPGLAQAPAGLDTPAIAAALASGELTAVYLLGVDPLHELPDRAAWEQALEHASTVIAHAAFLTDGLREHATVIFPAEAAAEKEGTVTHPDGRLQRLRPAIARQGAVRSEWWILAELAARLGGERAIANGAMASAALFDAVGFYAGLTLEELAGRGVRWPPREQAAALPAPSSRIETRPPRPLSRVDARALRAGSYRSIWASREVAASPALAFLHPSQRVEVSPAAAHRLGLRDGVEMLVADESGAGVRARVALRDAVPDGSAFLQHAIAADSANLLRGETVEIVPIPEPVEPPPPPEEEASVEEALV